MYFLGLSLRGTAKTIKPFVEDGNGSRSHVAVWYWVHQQFNPKQHLYPCKRVIAFLVDETQIQIGHDKAWLWVVAIEPVHRVVLGVHMSRHRNILVAEHFLKSLVEQYYGKHTIYSDGVGSWYPLTLAGRRKWSIDYSHIMKRV